VSARDADGPVVRPFERGDLEAVAEIMTVSFDDKVHHMTDLPHDVARDLMVETGPVSAAPFPGYLVAEVDGDVVGVLLLRWRGQTYPPKRDRHPRTGRTRWWDRTQFAFAQAIIDQRPRRGECYVAGIAVDPDARRMGVGAALMEEGEAIARREGLSTYALYVASDNERAIGLYRRLGFCRTGTLRSRLTAWLVGVGEWAHMEKDLR
jgi:ribosomal protein S18 acetylase RimI-like enzyme